MSAADLLTRAECAGVTLQAAGTRLLLEAGTPPPPGLLHELAGAKSELLALLQCRAEEAAERIAIRAEPSLPAIGTPERDRLDGEQRAIVAGLLHVAGNGKPWKPRADL